MKLIGLKEAKARLSEFVDAAQLDGILITRRGKPAALAIGVEGQDIEQVILASKRGVGRNGLDTMHAPISGHWSHPP